MSLSAPTPELLHAHHDRIEEARQIMRRFGTHGVPVLIVRSGQSGRVVSSSVLFGGLNALLTNLALQ